MRFRECPTVNAHAGPPPGHDVLTPSSHSRATGYNGEGEGDGQGEGEDFVQAAEQADVVLVLLEEEEEEGGGGRGVGLSVLPSCPRG